MIIESSGLKFDVRDEYTTDNVVIKEILDENVYEVDGGRFHEEGVTVDIGANIGAFSLLAAKHGCKVYAVEPEPKNLEALKNSRKTHEEEWPDTYQAAAKRGKSWTEHLDKIRGNDQVNMRSIYSCNPDLLKWWNSI